MEKLKFSLKWPVFAIIKFISILTLLVNCADEFSLILSVYICGKCWFAAAYNPGILLLCTKAQKFYSITPMFILDLWANRRINQNMLWHTNHLSALHWQQHKQRNSNAQDNKIEWIVKCWCVFWTMKCKKCVCFLLPTLFLLKQLTFYFTCITRKYFWLLKFRETHCYLYYSCNSSLSAVIRNKPIHV